MTSAQVLAVVVLGLLFVGVVLAMARTWRRREVASTAVTSLAAAPADLGAAGSREVRGAAAVAAQAELYSRLGLAMQPALINGAAGVVTTRDGRPFSIGAFTVRGGRIVEMDWLADAERLREDLELGVRLAESLGLDVSGVELNIG